VSFWHPDRLPLIFLGADDTRKSVTGTTETEVKYFRFNQPSINPFNKIKVNLSLWVTGGNGIASIYIDDEASPRLTLNTNSTSEKILSGEFNIGDLSAGIHTLRLKIKNDTSGQTVYTELLEVYAR